MGQGRAQLYNLISILFLVLSIAVMARGSASEIQSTTAAAKTPATMR